MSAHAARAQPARRQRLRAAWGVRGRACSGERPKTLRPSTLTMRSPAATCPVRPAGPPRSTPTTSTRCASPPVPAASRTPIPPRSAPPDSASGSEACVARGAADPRGSSSRGAPLSVALPNSSAFPGSAPGAALAAGPPAAARGSTTGRHHSNSWSVRRRSSGDASGRSSASMTCDPTGPWMSARTASKGSPVTWQPARGRAAGSGAARAAAGLPTGRLAAGRSARGEAVTPHTRRSRPQPGKTQRFAKI